MCVFIIQWEWFLGVFSSLLFGVQSARAEDTLGRSTPTSAIQLWQPKTCVKLTQEDTMEMQRPRNGRDRVALSPFAAHSASEKA